MVFQDFLEKWNGKPCDFDGWYGTQCMDLMHQYIYDVLGLTDARILAASAAKLVYTSFPSIFGSEYFEKIDNTPEGIPQEGDIIFWSNGEFGHVAVVISATQSKITSFDANYSITNCHVQEHTYGYCLGWFRFKKTAPQEQSEALKECLLQHSELVGKLDAIDAFRKSIAQSLFHGDEKDWQKIYDEVNKVIKEADDTRKQAKVGDQLWDEIVKETGIQTVKYTDESLKALLEALQGLKQAVPEGMTLVKTIDYEVLQEKANKPLSKYTGWQLINEGINKLLRK